jgi:hypothetical protein
MLPYLSSVPAETALPSITADKSRWSTRADDSATHGRLADVVDKARIELPRHHADRFRQYVEDALDRLRNDGLILHWHDDAAKKKRGFRKRARKVAGARRLDRDPRHGRRRADHFRTAGLELGEGMAGASRSPSRPVKNAGRGLSGLFRRVPGSQLSSQSLRF